MPMHIKQTIIFIHTMIEFWQNNEPHWNVKPFPGRLFILYALIYETKRIWHASFDNISLLKEGNKVYWKLYDNKRPWTAMPVQISLLSTVLPLYYRHAREFESSRKEFSSRGKATNVVFLSSSFPLLRKSRAGEFLAGTFKRARMTVIKQQDLKW